MTREIKEQHLPDPSGHDPDQPSELPSNLRDMNWFSNTFLEMLIRSLPGVFYLFDLNLVLLAASGQSLKIFPIKALRIL